MKKIMFNDSYSLTKAVLEGRKTMTRRIIPPIEVDWNRRGKVTLPVSSFRSGVLFMDTGSILNDLSEYFAPTKYQPKYKVGEVVAVAQSYEDVKDSCEDTRVSPLVAKAGYRNKMFVRADLMPHQLRITNVRVERLQDISDKEVYKEGFEKDTVNNGWGNYAHHWEAMLVYYDSIGRTREIRSPYPREAFAALIDKVSGNGTWESNPWVFVYEFELVR